MYRRGPPTDTFPHLCQRNTAAMWPQKAAYQDYPLSRWGNNKPGPSCFKTRRLSLSRDSSADRVPTQSAEFTAFGGTGRDQGPNPSPHLHHLRWRIWRLINQTKKKDPGSLCI